MKLFNKLLAFMLAFACVFALTACNKEDEEKLDTTKHGWAFECTSETDEDGNKYGLIKGLFLADGEIYALNEDDYTPLSLVIGKDKKIKVPVYDADKKATYKDDVLVTEEKEFDYFKVAESAFANQTIIGNVEVGDLVKEIGAGAFAGCSKIEKMVLPFVGTKVDAVNAGKIFPAIFGTTECTDCTSVTSNYNTSGTATYFVPNSLKEVVVNLAGENVSLNDYAFNKVVTIEKVVVNGNVKVVGNNAFEGCTGLYDVTLPDTVTTIGKKAFNGCTSIMAFDFPVALTTIFQEAFAGCSKLGYGKDTVVVLPASTTEVFEKAFANCTTMKNVDISKLAVVNTSVFYGCTNLESVVLAEDAVLNNNAFGKCEKIVAEKVLVKMADGSTVAYDFGADINNAFEESVKENIYG